MGYVMKMFVILLVAAILMSGCVAPAAEQTQQNVPETQFVEQAYALCKSTVDATPEAIRLSKFFVLGKNKHEDYLGKITDDRYVTDAQISDIRTYQANLKVCRDQAVKDLQMHNNDHAKLAAEYFREDSRITADIVARKVTIGEANRKVKKSEYSFSLKGYDLGK